MIERTNEQRILCLFWAEGEIRLAKKYLEMFNTFRWFGYILWAIENLNLALQWLSEALFDKDIRR